MLRHLLPRATGAFVLGSFFTALASGQPAVSDPAAAGVRLQIDDSPIASATGPVLSYADIIEPARRTVVSVYSSKVVRRRAPMNPLLRQFFGDLQDREAREEGLGSGVIVSADGYILTNNHVVAEADELNVALADGREFAATLVGTDPKTDVAVIRIEATDLPVATLADSDKLRVGDVVFALGNPLGIGQTVTMGIVSATGRNNLGLLEGGAGYENFIQTDAAINLGNSGGALIDARGRLIGINTAILSTTRGNIGIGFAIPVNLASTVMLSLVDTGSVQRGYLGVNVDTLTPEVAEALALPAGAQGVVIVQVTPESPAERAGLQRADAITAINGQPIGNIQDLRLRVAQLAPGTKIRLALVRDGREQSVEVELGSAEDDPGIERELLKGVELAPVDEELRRRLALPARVQGLVITRIAPDSPYARLLAVGMVIVEINRQPAESSGKARAHLRDGRNLFLIYHRGAYTFLPLEVRP